MAIDVTDATALIENQTALLAALQGLPAQVQGALATGNAIVPFYVDPAAGLDTNLGTQGAPLRTISKAITLAPSGRVSIIFLPATQAAICQLNMTDTPNGLGLFDLQDQFIQIQPITIPTVPNPTLQPTIQFNTIWNGTANVCPTFGGTGSLIFIGCNVEYPDLANPAVITNPPAAIEPGGTGNFFLSHLSCSILLQRGQAISTNAGGLSVNLSLNEINISPNVIGSPVLLSLEGNAPTTLEWLQNTLPAGITAKSLIQNVGGLVNSDSTPRGLLTNVLFQ